DTHATFHMITAHGTYVAPHLLRERERAYLHANNKKKRETSVESSNPVKGDDPWLMYRTRPQRAALSRTNQNGSAPAFSAGWRLRFMCRASARSSARSHAILQTASSPTRQNARSSAASSRRDNTTHKKET